MLSNAFNSSRKSDKSALSVIGILFDVKAGGNETNWFIESVLNNGTTLKAPNKYNVTNLNVNKFVDSIEKKNIYHYEGSLTTPGCSEIVEWIVLDNLQSISPEQLDKFTSKWSKEYSFAKGNGNNRVTQPINGRTIYYSGASKIF
jgi:carbonic anhydrase